MSFDMIKWNQNMKENENYVTGVQKVLEEVI